MAERTVANALTEIDGQFKATEMAPLNVIELPDGQYQVEIREPRVEISKSSQRLQIAWPLQVLSGEHKGKVITKYEGLEKPENFSYVKKTFAQLGLPEATSARVIPDLLVKASGLKLDIKVTTKDGFNNIYFGRLIRPENVSAGRRVL